MNKRNRSIFITGVTGLVGSYLLKILSENNCKIYALVREKDANKPEDRVRKIVKFWNGKVSNNHSRNIVVLEGDIGRRGLGLNTKITELLNREIEEIYHCAALTKFNATLAELRKINVNGTKNILDFAQKCNVLKKVNHISTAYVCGNHKGMFNEENLDTGQRFDIPYEQSKFEAEKLIGEYRQSGLWIDIFRPVLVVGESKTGKTTTFSQSVYQLLRIWNHEIFWHFPIKNCSINIVFVDDLCRSIHIISTRTNSMNQNYHTFDSKTISLEAILNIANKFLKFKKPKMVSRIQFMKNGLTPVQKALLKNNILIYNCNVKFDSRRTNKVLKKYQFKFTSFNQKNFLKLLEYSVKRGFLIKKRKFFI